MDMPKTKLRPRGRAYSHLTTLTQPERDTRRSKLLASRQTKKQVLALAKKHNEQYAIKSPAKMTKQALQSALKAKHKAIAKTK